jgi:hypothetical protein
MLTVKQPHQTLSGPPGPPGGLGAPEEGPIASTRQVSDWYVRIIAESPAEDLCDTRNVLGQLSGSEDGYDMRDLPELAPHTSPYLTVVFPHDDWGDRADNYTSDFHPPGWARGDEWVFQVHSDSPYRDVRLGWENVTMLQRTCWQAGDQCPWTVHRTRSGAPLMDKMWLEDVDTGEVIKVAVDGVPRDYWFNMDGQTVRTFRWMLKGLQAQPTGKAERDGSHGSTATGDTLGLAPSSIEHPPLPGRDD